MQFNSIDSLEMNGGDSITFSISGTDLNKRYEVILEVTPIISTNIFDNRLEDKVEFSLFPNPTVRTLNVKTDNITSGVSFNIFDMSGRLVKQGNLYNTSVDVSDLNNGIYIINLIVGNEMVSKRFMKN